MNSLPFTIRGVFTNFVDLEGIARLDGTDLVLEFRTFAFGGLIKSQPKELRIALNELEEVSFRRVLFRGELNLRARRMGTFANIPGTLGCELRLRCRRSHVEFARELASNLNMRLVEVQLKGMISQTDPPPIP